MKEFFETLISTWWGILIICILAAAVWIFLSALLYRRFFKRFYDIVLSGIGIAALSPVFLVLIVLGAVKMKGNPFFTQLRPGKDEKIFRLIKFRTMTCEKDSDGNLLPDEKRLTRYGRILRSTSLDELPELFNIFVGQMSIVGPRPLLVQYLDLYTEEQRQRHNVRPGLTGLAQTSGRNAISWEDKFKKDIEYVNKFSLVMDLQIICKTVISVFSRKGISQEGQATMEFFKGTANKQNKQINVLILSAGRRVELVNCFKNAAKRLNINGAIIAADISDTAPALYFADKHYIIPKIFDKDYLNAVIELCNNENVSLIIPTIDTELEILAENKDFIQKNTKAKVMISDAAVVSVCCDKLKTAEYFTTHGFDCPHIFTSSTSAVQQYTFPLFIKPRNGSSSINTFKVKNEYELKFFVEYIPDPIVQEFISGREYTVDCFSDFDGNIITIVPRVRLATRGGEILKGKIDKNRIVIDNVKRLVTSFGFIGHITVQCFLCDDNTVKYIEINPRFGGGAPMSIMAGADSCENLYRILMGQKLKYNENYENGVIFSRFDSSIRIEKN